MAVQIQHEKLWRKADDADEPQAAEPSFLQYSFVHPVQ